MVMREEVDVPLIFDGVMRQPDDGMAWSSWVYYDPGDSKLGG